MKEKKICIYFEADLDAGEIFRRIMEYWLESIITGLTCFGNQIDLGTLQCLEKCTLSSQGGNFAYVHTFDLENSLFHSLFHRSVSAVINCF